MSEPAVPLRQRQGPRDLRARRRASAPGRERPHLDLRRRPADRDPRQGARADGPLGASGSPRRRRSSPTTCSPSAADGRSTDCRRLEMLPIECVVRGYLAGLGLEGLPGQRRGLRAPAARRAASSRSSSRSRSSPRRPRRRAATTRTSTGRPPSSSSARSASTRSSGVTIELYRFASERAAARGIILADTKLEFGIDAGGPARARRRGVHARLVAVLAARRLSRRAARSRRSTSSSSATTSSRSAGTRRRRGRRSPTRWSQGTRARYVEAFERLTGIGFDDYLADPEVVLG